MMLNIKSKIAEYFASNNVCNIAFDSREVGPGYAFFAIQGEVSDGNDYIDTSLEKGASIIFTDKPSMARDKVVLIENTRIGLAIGAEMLYSAIPTNILANLII